MEEINNENDSHNQPTASWNLAEFLPSAIRENFYIIVLIFIEQLHKTKPLNPFLVNQQKEGESYSFKLISSVLLGLFELY